jgi:hypothetical protein
LAHDIDGTGNISILDALELIAYSFIYYFPTPSPPFGECGRFARLKSSPHHRVLPCEDYPPCR